MRQINDEEIALVAGGENCMVDYREAHGITDCVFTPAVMVWLIVKLQNLFVIKLFLLHYEDVQMVIAT